MSQAAPAPAEPQAADAASVAYSEPAAPATGSATGTGTAALPKMDADGFQHREAGSSYYSHAQGTMGAAAVDEPTSAPTKTADATPVSMVPLPKMDADGFQPRESGSNLYNHAQGTMGAP